MKKLLLTLLLCTTWTLSSNAQYTVESVRKTYQDVHQWMADMKNLESDVEPTYIDLHIVDFLPATGTHKEKIRMYFDEEWPDGEEEIENWDGYPKHHLRFVTAEYNFAASEYYEEYLFDQKGQLLFVYAITIGANSEDDFIPYELRLWLNGDQPLQFTVKKIDDEDHGFDLKSLRKAKYNTVYTGTSIPENYQEATDFYLQRGAIFLKMFSDIYMNSYK